MGMKSKSAHFGSGAGGPSKREGKLRLKSYDPWEHDPLYKELAKSGKKFNKKDVKFVVKDKSGQLIWLEKGNSKSGLEHIVQRHEQDFKKLHGVSRDNIAPHVKNIISQGDIEYSKTVFRNNRSGFEKLYSYKGEYHLLAGIGNNGYLVSSYALSEKTAKIYLRRNKKWKKKL